MTSSHDSGSSEEPRLPDRGKGKFSVGVCLVVRGVEYDVPDELKQELLDFDLKWHMPFRVLRRGYRAERKRIQAELDAWVSTQSAAGLGRPATRRGFDHLRQSREPWHDDPTVDAALERLHALLDELPLTRFGLQVDERGVIQVEIRPFRARHVRRIKATCGATSVEITRAPRD